MIPKSAPRELKPQSKMAEVILGLALLAGSFALAAHAVSLYTQGKQYNVLEDAGFSIIVLGGSFDPVNFIWLCLPFTRNQVAVPARFATVGWIIGGIGVMFFVVGLIGKHWYP